MRTQMMTSILNCAKCKVFEKMTEPKVPLCNIVASEPMDLIHVDLLGLETTMDPQVTPSVQKILVVTDHFSHHVQPTKYQTSEPLRLPNACMMNTFTTMDSPDD